MFVPPLPTFRPLSTSSKASGSSRRFRVSLPWPFGRRRQRALHHRSPTSPRAGRLPLPYPTARFALFVVPAAIDTGGAMSSQDSDSPVVPGGFSVDANYSPNPGLLQRPNMPPRTLSHSAADTHPRSGSSPSPSQRGFPNDSMHRSSSTASLSDGAAGAASDAEGSSSRSQRAMMDRVKSRAVDSEWDWEAERARMESEGLPSSSSSSLASDKRVSLIAPVAPPRHSSRTPNIPTIARPRIDTSSRGQGAPSGSSSRPASPFGSSGRLADDAPPASAIAHPAAQPPASREREKPSGSSGSKRDQSCDACGKPMTGQFVRALGVVFHLDCFRCRVSLYAYASVCPRRMAVLIHLVLALATTGLQQSRRVQILSCDGRDEGSFIAACKLRRRRQATSRSKSKAVPTLRDGLLSKARSSMCKVWGCPTWELHYRSRCQISRRALYMLHLSYSLRAPRQLL